MKQDVKTKKSQAAEEISRLEQELENVQLQCFSMSAKLVEGENSAVSSSKVEVEKLNVIEPCIAREVETLREAPSQLNDER